MGYMLCCCRSLTLLLLLLLGILSGVLPMLIIALHRTALYRGEFVEGTTMRLVTVTGPPASAQTAYAYLNRLLKLSAQSEGGGKGSGGGRDSK